MIDINIINFVTIGVISLAAWALFKWIIAYFGISANWAA